MDIEIEKMNLYQKMLAIQSELGVVQKNLNLDNKYKAVSERDIIDNVKPLEEKYHVLSIPSNRTIIESQMLQSEKTYNGAKKIVTTFFERIQTTMIFVNVDNPTEKIEIISFGDGIDVGDKSVGKAMTYSDKYALMKAYKISTGDDPDKEASTEEHFTKKLANEDQLLEMKELGILDVSQNWCEKRNVQLTEELAATLINKKKKAEVEQK